MKSPTVLIDRHPGRSTQTLGIARAIGTDPDLIHEPSVGVVGTKGDSQCYLGVMAKVEAIHNKLKGRIGAGQGQLKLRLVQPEYTVAISDGIRNGTREMRYSLIGREVTNDALCEHLSATGLPARSRSSPATSRRSARSPPCSSTIDPRSSCRTGRSIPATIPRPARHSTSSAPTRSPATPTPPSASTSPPRLPGHRQLRRHVHL